MVKHAITTMTTFVCKRYHGFVTRGGWASDDTMGLLQAGDGGAMEDTMGL